MRFGILGPFEVVDDEGRELALGGPKQRAVLAVLLLHAGEVISSDRLIDDVWGDRAPRTAAKTIQVYVSNLRKALGNGRLATHGQGYTLRTEDAEIDADRFGALVADGRRELDAGNPQAAVKSLREALGLWRGRPLVEFAYEPFAQNEVARLEETRLGALEDRFEAELALGRHAGLVAELEALVREHPWRERLHAQLMLALYRAGRQADALEVYQRARAHLADELGLEPGPALKALQAQVLEQSPALEPEANSNAHRHTPSMRAATRAPEGTIALVFTDIEGSTQLATELGPDWPRVLAEHHELVGGALAAEGGFIEGTEGDAFFATFTDAQAAARAAVAAMRSLRSHSWPEAVGELRVRMGLHVGRVDRTETGYVGLEVHRAARVAAAAHGGELLLTAVARELVGDELVCESVGVHRLKDFPAPLQLFCAMIDGRGAAHFPPPQTESVRPTNLPAGKPQLVGRDDELEQVLDAVVSGDDRLVTITGRGGAGKTSLALLAGIEVLDRHPGGVWWVDLTSVDSPDEVAVAIGAVVGAEREQGGSLEAALETRLRHSGATLMILDNMEHVLTAAGTLCALLSHLPDLRLVVTSRMPLHVEAERVILLDALDERAALELIGRSVRRRGRPAKLTEPDGDVLRDIVRLLDGLPLALELAASRLSVLTPTQLRDRLRASIDVLSDVRGHRPPRQRSLRAALESTLTLLDPTPRALFVRLGVFAGPVELEELERVLSGDGVSVLEALAELVDAALAQRIETGDGTVKFGLPEALRQIASELLDREPDGQRWRRAHAQRQYELMWAYRTTLVDRKTYLAAHAADREAAAALRWATANRDPLEQPIAAAYAVLILSIGRNHEAGVITERLVASPPADAEAGWLALWAHSGYLLNVGRPDEARRFADEAYRAAPDLTTRCAALIIRGLSNVFGGRTSEGVNDHAQATALARELNDDPAFLAGALVFEAQALIQARFLDEAAALLDEARLVGAPVDANTLHYLNTHLGDLALMDGRPADALEPYARSLERALADGNLEQISADLTGVTEALAALGHDAESLEVAGMAESQSAEIGSVPNLLGFERLADLQQRIGPVSATELKERGRAGDPADRVARAVQLARSHARAPADARE